jgi:hypothetical protein
MRVVGQETDPPHRPGRVRRQPCRRFGRADGFGVMDKGAGARLNSGPAFSSPAPWRRRVEATCIQAALAAPLPARAAAASP